MVELAKIEKREFDQQQEAIAEQRRREREEMERKDQENKQYLADLQKQIAAREEERKRKHNERKATKEYSKLDGTRRTRRQPQLTKENNSTGRCSRAESNRAESGIASQSAGVIT